MASKWSSQNLKPEAFIPEDSSINITTVLQNFSICLNTSCPIPVLKYNFVCDT